MSTSSPDGLLRSKLIRLAHTNPDLRPQVLSMLRTSAEWTKKELEKFDNQDAQRKIRDERQDKKDDRAKSLGQTPKERKKDEPPAKGKAERERQQKEERDHQRKRYKEENPSEPSGVREKREQSEKEQKSRDEHKKKKLERAKKYAPKGEAPKEEPKPAEPTKEEGPSKEDKSKAQETAKKEFNAYKEEHPGTKKTVGDFFKGIWNKMTGKNASLRDSVIRLAHQQPHLRGHLLPLLTAGNVLPFTGSWKGSPADQPDLQSFMEDLSIGEEYESSTSLVRAHRFRDSLRVTDLTNAGKRGKSVSQFALYDIREPASYDVSESYGELVSAIRRDTVKFGALLMMAKEIARLGEGDSTAPKIEVSAYKGVDVKPAGFSTIVVAGKFVHVQADYGDFHVRDTKDQNNLPTCIPAIKGGKKDILVFHRWVTDNRDRIDTMTFSEVLSGMSDAGIRYHYYCAVD